MEQELESLATQALTAVESSRREMLFDGARTLLGWGLSVDVIMEITGLPKEDIVSLQTRG
ncbi:MAG: hypothetical protein FWD51_05370 [Betaproteobacteria bacterium]|nr:hypothetical protein [Betaproteobacteria bacterium]